MSGHKHRVCPVERAGILDGRIRRWLHNPEKILGPHVREGMTALDIGCGPGFFSVEMARMVGETGKVAACDLQQGMLDRLRGKLLGTALENRVVLHRCAPDRVGWTGRADFVLAFYVVHEVPDPAAFFSEIAGMLGSGGRMLVAEPSFHVSGKEFEKSIQAATTAGFTLEKRPGILLARTALLEKA